MPSASDNNEIARKPSIYSSSYVFIIICVIQEDIFEGKTFVPEFFIDHEYYNHNSRRLAFLEGNRPVATFEHLSTIFKKILYN